MSRYRSGPAALAASACAAAFALSACSAGITTGRPPAPPSAVPSHRAAPSPPPSHSPSPSPSPSAARTVRLNAELPAFPIPRGASVQYNGSCRKQVMLMLGPVTPAKSIAFYNSALPRAGYRITGNMTAGSGDTTMMELEFTGHGYTGNIGAFVDLGKAIDSGTGSSGPAMPGSGLFSSMTKNITEIGMTLPGVPDTYMCPGS